MSPGHKEAVSRRSGTHSSCHIDISNSSPGEKGDKKVLEENFFVEKMLGTDPIEPLSDEVMNEYRKPFINPGEDRRPTLDWPRQIPIDNEPIDVYNEVKDNLKFMMETPFKNRF